MSVLDEVNAALVDTPGHAWQRALAIALAGEMDAKPNASIAGQLRLINNDMIAWMHVLSNAHAIRRNVNLGINPESVPTTVIFDQNGSM